MPLSNHLEKPTHKATIVDITCDSDGCLDRFVDRRDVKSVLDLHTPAADKPYYLGFFLVGAYQESLASEHNLFGAINEAEIAVDHEGNWKIIKTTHGDPIDELLISRNYDAKEMLASFREQIKKAKASGKIKDDTTAAKLMKKLKEYMKAMPYLSGTSV
jgi:arginine decarboxylase